MTFLSLSDASLISAMPTPEELHKEIPLRSDHEALILQWREELQDILEGKDPRFLLIIGPCSIHDPLSAKEYAKKLTQLAELVSDKLFIVMRAYFEKPRTISGWKGMLYDPLLDGSYDLAFGLKETRKLLSDLTSLGIPVGSEMLEITTAPYYSDFLSWGCIGARTTTSPPHRQLASSLSLPIGFKNTTDGNLDHPIQAVVSASEPHTFLSIDPSGQMCRLQTEGNPYCHIVLRGGRLGPNYHKEALAKAQAKCERAGISPHLLVDCSHDNCSKNHLEQIPAMQSIIEQRVKGNRKIIGAMLESHLLSGKQPLQEKLRYGVSITDPCLDWKETERLILYAYQQLKGVQTHAYL